jgi:IS6 family transposase
VELRLGPLHGLKRFRSTAITIAGIELLRRIHKGQVNLGRLCIEGANAPTLWDAVLAA